MSAVERVAWLELIVSASAVAIVSAMYPWLGTGALGGFGVLGFVAFGVYFLRRQGQIIAVDERDREIERRATHLGVQTAWMVLFLALTVLVLWSSYHDQVVVSTSILTWLVFSQFAICYGMKGLVSILAYRRRHCAS